MNKQWLFLAAGLIRHQKELPWELAGHLLLWKGRTDISVQSKVSIWLRYCLWHWSLVDAQGKIMREKGRKKFCFLSPHFPGFIYLWLCGFASRRCHPNHPASLWNICFYGFLSLISHLYSLVLTYPLQNFHLSSDSELLFPRLKKPLLFLFPPWPSFPNLFCFSLEQLQRVHLLAEVISSRLEAFWKRDFCQKWSSALSSAPVGTV